jgi:Domain of unknown function (DUF4190)
MTSRCGREGDDRQVSLISMTPGHVKAAILEGDQSASTADGSVREEDVMAGWQSRRYGLPAEPGYQSFPSPPRMAAYAPGMNGLAIMALVSVFIFGPLAVLLGHMARHQIRRSGESGAGIALGALIIGYVETIAFVALVLIIVSQANASYA